MQRDLQDYLRILRKRRRIVVGALVVCLGAAALVSYVSTPVYEAESRLFVGQRQVATTDVLQGVQATQLSFQLLRSYTEVVKSRSLAEQVVERADLPLLPSDIAETIEAEPVRDTQVLRIRFRSADPILAQRVVNGVATLFAEQVEQIEVTAGQGDASEPAVKVSVIDSAIQPEHPVSPRPKRNMAVGLLLGGMLGVGLAMLREQLDTTVKDRNDIEQTLGLPLAAVIPNIDTQGAELHLERDGQGMAAESFRKVRSAIQFLSVEHPVHTLLVTSPFAREGKTTNALNLAAAFAQGGARTILVEADLRRPTLHKLFASVKDRGLTTHLVGHSTLRESVFPTPVDNLAHMPAGAIPPNPAELLSSRAMVDLLEALKSRFDMVVVDAPPVLPVADAAILASRVDGVLLIARAGATHRDRLSQAVQQVHKAGGRALGVVLNALKGEDAEHGYYYYGYRSEPAPFESTRAVPTPSEDKGRVDVPGRRGS